MAIDPGTASLASAGLDFVGGFFGGSSAKKAAAAQIAFQREVLQHQHQWEVADLRAAGLNPILSAGGSGPGGASGAMDMSGQIMANSASSAAGKLLQSAALEQQATQADLNRAATKAQEADVVLKLSNARAVDATTAKARAWQPLWDTMAKGISSAKRLASDAAPAFSSVEDARKPNHPKSRKIPMIEVRPY